MSKFAIEIIAKLAVGTTGLLAIVVYSYFHWWV